MLLLLQIKLSSCYIPHTVLGTLVKLTESDSKSNSVYVGCMKSIIIGKICDEPLRIINAVRVMFVLSET